MLRQAGRLLPQGALCRALSSSQQLQQANPWVQQSRSRSDAAGNPSDAAGFVHNPVDGSAAEILDHADSLLSAAQAASDATVLAAKADCWWGTRVFIDLLMKSHDEFNMPWAEAITVTNLVLKLSMVPATIVLQRESPKMQVMKAEAEKVQKINLQMNQARTAAEYERHYAEYKAAMADFRQRNKGRMWASVLMPFLAIFQGALFISQFSAISVLTREKLPSMTYEGALWFKDLTVSDPYFGLPIIAAAATVAMFQSANFSAAMGQAAAPSGGGPNTADFMKKFSWFLALTMIPAGQYVGSGVALLWASNAVITIVQNKLLATPSVRRALGLPVQGEVQTPGKGLLEQFQFLGAGNRRRAPPAPGTPPQHPVVVNYVPHKPRRRGKMQ